jgi:glutamine synthetase
MRQPLPRAYAALLMAGLDGIENKIHPGGDGQEPLRPAAGRAGRSRPSAARCAKRWTASKADRDFLLKGGVFTEDQIEPTSN